MDPANPFPPSSLIPKPEEVLYSSIRPVSGANPFTGSSVVILH